MASTSLDEFLRTKIKEEGRKATLSSTIAEQIGHYVRANRYAKLGIDKAKTSLSAQIFELHIASHEGLIGYRKGLFLISLGSYHEGTKKLETYLESAERVVNLNRHLRDVVNRESVEHRPSFEAKADHHISKVMKIKKETETRLTLLKPKSILINGIRDTDPMKSIATFKKARKVIKDALIQTVEDQKLELKALLSLSQLLETYARFLEEKDFSYLEEILDSVEEVSDVFPHAYSLETFIRGMLKGNEEKMLKASKSVEPTSPFQAYISLYIFRMGDIEKFDTETSERVNRNITRLNKTVEEIVKKKLDPPQSTGSYPLRLSKGLFRTETKTIPVYDFVPPYCPKCGTMEPSEVGGKVRKDTSSLTHTLIEVRRCRKCDHGYAVKR